MSGDSESVDFSKYYATRLPRIKESTSILEIEDLLNDVVKLSDQSVQSSSERGEIGHLEMELITLSKKVRQFME
jgi:hypothetical protein